MKFLGRLSRRVVLTSVLTGIVGATVTLVLARSTVASTLSTAIRQGHDAVGQARCEANPSAWVQRGLGDTLYYGYDASTLRSLNPAAPPLDPALAHAVTSRSRDLAFSGAGTGGQIVFRGAASGACSLIGASWTGRYATMPAARLVLSAAVLTALAGALLGLMLVVGPLVRRTQALERAANALGSSHGLSGAGPSDDELDNALNRLSAAEVRIRDDARTLQEQSTALQRHLGDVAHDVRTPLAALQLTLEQLSDEAPDDATRERLAQALSECVAVSNVTENLRLQSLVEDGLQPTIKPIDDLARVLERIVLRAQSLARRKGVTVELAQPDEAVALDGDEIFLERGVSNLVDNAVRYGERDGHVAVLLRVEAGAFVVTVRDDGPGVSSDELARLGERTFRADAARQRDPRGTGLGLAITGELCRRCGWSLSFARLDPRGLEAVIRGLLRRPGSTLSP
jgi:signal transduction histidine kinase